MSNKFIDKLTLQNFKSIKQLIDFPLNNINILIGANGAGKSNFTKFFTFLAAAADGGDRLNRYVIEKGGVDAFLTFGQKYSQLVGCNIKFNVEKKPYEYGFMLTPTLQKTFRIDVSGTDLHKNIQGTSQTNIDGEIDKHIREPLKKIQVFHLNDTGDTSPIKKQVAMNDNLFLRADGENIMGMIRHIYDKYPQHYKLIVSTIKLVVADFHDFVIRDDAYVQLEWYSIHNPDTPLLGHFLSDGSLRFICLATLLLMPDGLLPNTIIIDEPELGLHPHALLILSDLINRLSLKRQFIISTQSTEFIDFFAARDIIVVDKNKDGTSNFKRLSDEELGNWLKDYSLSDIWGMNIIGGRP
jgi:predicted ATPase